MTDDRDIKELSPQQLIARRTEIDARLEEIRAAHIEQAQALGLVLVSADGKKTKRRRSSSSKETE